VFGRHGGSEDGSVLLSTLGYSALAVFFGAFLVAAITAPVGSVRQRVAEHPVLRAFGRYSYCLYVIHLPIAYAITSRSGIDFAQPPTLAGSQLLAQLVYFATLGALCFAVAWASWHLYEKRWLALKDRFPYEQRARSEAAAERALRTEADAFAAP
jgi:peptidoglycan/LPS O-acetylase OafA/YrhL